MDAQPGYILKGRHTTLQAGVTNVFDAANLQVYGAPSTGRIGYFGLLFATKQKKIADKNPQPVSG